MHGSTTSTARIPLMTGALVMFRPYPAQATSRSLEKYPASLERGDHVAVHQRAGQSHRQLAGEVVIAGAGKGQCRSGTGRTQRANRHRRRQCLQGFHRSGDLGTGQAVVPVAARGADPDQAALGEPVQMGAGRGRSDAGQPGQLTGWAGLTVHQGKENGGTGGLAHEGRGDGEFALCWHECSVERQYFGVQRNDSVLASTS